jgi:putative ubiquitin-RnfH superfamily antitoxin RatB of RatAB toxin-antitoxin module
VKASVAIALAEGQHVVELELPDGSRVADALAAPRVRALLDRHGLQAEVVGIWARRCAPETLLREGDRVEVYRPLAADPKSMRRERARLKPSTRSRSGR